MGERKQNWLVERLSHCSDYESVCKIQPKWILANLYLHSLMILKKQSMQGNSRLSGNTPDLFFFFTPNLYVEREMS